jgi:hypothetical protein
MTFPQPVVLWMINLSLATGLVALDNRLAEHMDLPPTLPHPYDPKLNLYQVNAFHSLHCLVRSISPFSCEAQF